MRKKNITLVNEKQGPQAQVDRGRWIDCTLRQTLNAWESGVFLPKCFLQAMRPREAYVASLILYRSYAGKQKYHGHYWWKTSWRLMAAQTGMDRMAISRMFQGESGFRRVIADEEGRGTRPQLVRADGEAILELVKELAPAKYAERLLKLSVKADKYAQDREQMNEESRYVRRLKEWQAMQAMAEEQEMEFHDPKPEPPVPSPVHVGRQACRLLYRGGTRKHRLKLPRFWISDLLYVICRKDVAAAVVLQEVLRRVTKLEARPMKRNYDVGKRPYLRSIRGLAKDMGLSKTTVEDAIRNLEDWNLIVKRIDYPKFSWGYRRAILCLYPGQGLPKCYEDFLMEAHELASRKEKL